MEINNQTTSKNAQVSFTIQEGPIVLDPVVTNIYHQKGRYKPDLRWKSAYFIVSCSNHCQLRAFVNVAWEQDKNVVSDVQFG